MHPKTVKKCAQQCKNVQNKQKNENDKIAQNITNCTKSANSRKCAKQTKNHKKKNHRDVILFELFLSFSLSFHLTLHFSFYLNKKQNKNNIK